jgi:sugar (pentulose or hexulose) kinase
MPENNYIAIDLGAESGRVMLGTLTEAGIALGEVHRFANLQLQVPTKNPNGSLHWDLLRLWHEIKVGLGKAAAACPPDSVAGIGVDTWGVDFGLLDNGGNLLGNPVCYRDPRSIPLPEAVFRKISQQKIYSITGIQTMHFNTLFQLAALAFANSPQLAAASHVLFLPDLINYWLTGRMFTEYTIASTSQMLDAKTREFSPEILAALNISPALFPRLDMPAESGSIRGLVLPTASEQLAADKTPVIAVASHDTASAVAAVPADSSRGDGGGWLYLSSGTWSLLGAEVDEPVLTEKAAGYNITNEGGIGGKIRLLKNIAGLWLLQECRREWLRQGNDLDYTSLTRLAAGAPAHLASLNVDDPVFAQPGNMPEKIAAQCRATGQKCPKTPGEFTRVILESLAGTYAKVARMLEEVTGKKFKTLHIVGGGSQNDLLNQLAANATGMTVLAGPVEATALGNILAQAITTRALPNLAAGRALIAKSVNLRTFTPQAA